MHRWIACSLFTLGSISLFAADKKASLGVQVTPHEAQRRVDITIDGKPFTSYVWPTSLKKPVLYPLIADGGVEVTRGFPLAPREGERQDHPHHAGMWFNYGNVNGFDFWNNSDAIPLENRAKMGTIQQKRIVSTKSGSDRGDLTVESTWITGKGEPLLQQTTHYIFMRHGDARMIDETVTLRALNQAIFHDDKEGLLGIRVARWLESPDEKSGIFTDANGKQTKVEGPTGAGATGIYTTSEGKTGDAAWATRGRWCMLVGHNSTRKNITVAILDLSSNPNSPTFWHARGYGLFAANPLGQHIFDPKAPQLDFTIEKGQSATFHHRVLLLTHSANAAEMNEAEDAFAKTAK